MNQLPIQPVVSSPRPSPPINDPQSNPEPASPSLPDPDPGIFRREPAPSQPASPASKPKSV